jgi:NAD(P)-dependent dehydrogenase (short-subunit alcohol dehydrogenase family)
MVVIRFHLYAQRVRSVIVTGVSRGIGAALFDEFLAAGDRILALGRHFTPRQEAAQRSDPKRVRLRPVDLSYIASLPHAREFAPFVQDASQVVLVHNAAVVDPVGAIGTLVAGEIQHAVAVNLTAPLVLTNEVLAAAGDRPVTVLYISTGATKRHLGGWAVYSATKLGAEFFTEALAEQVRDNPGVRVAVVQPGVVDTDMQARLRQHAASGVYFPDRESFVGLHERGELADPAAVARQILADHL